MSDIVSSLILFFGCSLTGWIFVGVAFYTRRYQQKKEELEREITTGKIVGSAQKTHRGGRRTTVYYVPVVEFEANGRSFRLENENGYREREKIQIGKTVDILYDENEPTHFHLAEDDSNEVASQSLMSLGWILIAGAFILTLCNYYFHIFW